MRKFCFSKSSRLKSNKEFKEVLDARLVARDSLLSIFVKSNKLGRVRLGVSVSKACGNAVVRNRLKRLIREAFRKNQYDIPSELDYLVMISPILMKELRKARLNGQKLSLPAYQDVCESFMNLCEQFKQKL